MKWLLLLSECLIDLLWSLFPMWLACFGQSRKRGDEEAQQIQVPWGYRPEMDLSDSWRGCESMQLHASYMQTQHQRWIRSLEQCLSQIIKPFWRSLSHSLRVSSCLNYHYSSSLGVSKIKPIEVFWGIQKRLSRCLKLAASSWKKISTISCWSLCYVSYLIIYLNGKYLVLTAKTVKFILNIEWNE